MFPRVFVDYTALLEDWRRETKRFSAELVVELDCSGERAVDEFLTPDLRHRRSGQILDRFGVKWISEFYDVMYAPAQDQPVDTLAPDHSATSNACSRPAADTLPRQSRGYGGRSSSNGYGCSGDRSSR